MQEKFKKCIASLVSFCVVLGFFSGLAFGENYYSSSGKALIEIERKTTKGCKMRFQVDPNKPSEQSEGKTIEWNGGCKNGYVHGKGEVKILASNGHRIVYKGEVSEGREEGYGTTEFVRTDGKKIFLSGVKQRGFVQGDGRMSVIDSSGKTVVVYTGNFIDDRPVGRGKIEFQDGVIYEGDVVNLVPHGVGKFVYPNGSLYEGGVKSRKLNGKGVFTFADGRSIQGFFVDGNFPVAGRIDYPNGSYYEGELKDAKPNGKGVSVSPDRTRFSGSFSDGNPDGDGFITKADGHSIPVRMSGGVVQILPTPEQLAEQSRESRRAEIDQRAYENAVNACRLRVANMPTPATVGEVLARAGQCNIDPESFRVQTIVVQQRSPESISCIRTGPFVNCNVR